MRCPSRLLVPIVGAILLALPHVAPAAEPPALMGQWGTYGSGDGQFAYPVGIATDAGGAVYVVDQNNQRVQKFTAGGAYELQWGSYGSGDGQFRYPFGVAVGPTGDVYVLDANNGRVERFTGSGGYLGQWSGSFGGNMAIATDAAGDVYVADRGTCKVWKFDPSGAALADWSFAPAPPPWMPPNQMIGVAVAGGLVYVTDSPAGRVVAFTDAGEYAGEWSSSGDGPLTSPGAIAAGGGHIYVLDGQSRVQEFTAVGASVTSWGSSGSGPGQFSIPYGIGTGPHGEIYVADTFNHRIQVFGNGAVPARSRTWGSLKALYR